MTESRLRRLRSALRGNRAPERPEFPSAWDDWHRRRGVAERHFVPWLEQVQPLRSRCVLEYGSGYGSVTAAFAPLAARYIGLDIDAEAVATARRILAEGGLEPELVAAPPDRILDETAGFRGEVDVFLCYAVLEHMSVDERLALLETARAVVRPGGLIVVIETPNRLTPWDYHTSQLPFLNQLPEDLALRYALRSPRAEFVDAMREAHTAGPDAEREAFTRWGRGMSFHEFDLVFGDVAPHIVASSWDPLLLGEREVYREELALQRILDRAYPELPGNFSRYWLDFVLTPEPRAEPPSLLRPWSLRTTASQGALYEADETIALTAPDGVLTVELPVAGARLVVGLDSAEEDRTVTVQAAPGGAEVTAPVERGATHSVFAVAAFDAPAERYEVRLDRPGRVSFVLYEG